MGVYIKGMEMPHDCDECRLCAFIPVGDYAINRKCLPLNAKAEITIRKANCPLVPVPPHGRLIDADAFCEKILEIVERQKYDDFYPKSLSVGEILREVVRELRGKGFDGFDNAPTIISAEEGTNGNT